MLGIFYNLGGYNKDLFIFINHHTNIAFLPIILKAISSIFFIANFAIAYFAICAYFYYKIKKSTKPAQAFETVYYELVRVGICYALFGITFTILKFSVNLPRPFCSLTDFVTILDTSLERCLSSFPSAHTGLSILATYCLWPYINKVLRLFLCAIIIAVALSRITLAMHYPADILYSIVVTTITIIFSNYIYKLFKPNVITSVKNFIIRLLFS